MSRSIQHAHINFPAAQLFDLVADVKEYPKFLPWVIATRVLRRERHTMWVEMTMGSGFLVRQFSTVAHLDHPHRIDITSHDAMFRRFEQHWRFKDSKNGGTDIEYSVDYEIKSRLLGILIERVVRSQAAKMVAAFKARAHELYGASFAIPRK